MGLLDSVFGSAPEAEVTQHSTLRPEQEQILKQLSGIFNKRGADATPFPGDLNVGLSGLEGVSLQALENRSEDLLAGESEVLNRGKGALVDLLTSQPADIDDFFTTNVQEPILTAFEDNLGTIGRRFSKNFFGTGRKEQESRAFEDTFDALTKERSSAAFNERNRTLDRTLAATGLVPEIAGAETNELLKLLGAGGVPRGVETDNLLRQYQEFVRQQGQGDQQIAQMIATLGVPTLENIATVTGGSQGLLGGFLSGGGGGVTASALLGLL